MLFSRLLSPIFLPHFLLCVTLCLIFPASASDCVLLSPPLISLPFPLCLFSPSFVSLPISFVFGLSVSSFFLLCLCLFIPPFFSFPSSLCFFFSSPTPWYYLSFLAFFPSSIPTSSFQLVLHLIYFYLSLLIYLFPSIFYIYFSSPLITFKSLSLFSSHRLLPSSELSAFLSSPFSSSSLSTSLSHPASFAALPLFLCLLF